MTVVKLRLPNQAHLFDYIKANAAHGLPMCEANTRLGKTVAICGAGPTLRGQYPVGDEVWACNSALPYLLSRSVEVTHGFCIDQGEEMLATEEWGSVPDVEYLVASSVNPKLVELLLGKGRSLTMFHSYLGIPNPDGWVSDIEYEMHLYTRAAIFGSSIQVGHGLNSVPRAVCLALAMGFAHVYVYGADCACAPAPKMPDHGTPEYAEWMRALVFYADDRRASTYSVKEAFAEATIDGRLWHSRPDMVISACHLAEMVKQVPGRITLLGETLPNAIVDKDDEFWARLPKLTGFGVLSGFGNAAQEAA